MIRAFRCLIKSASFGHNGMVLQISKVGRDCEDQDGPRVLSTLVREKGLEGSRFEEHGTHKVFMNVEHWKGGRWDEDWCALTEDLFDGAEAVDWKKMYDILRAVSRVPRKGRRNWKISGRHPFYEAQGLMLEERAQIATSVERMVSLEVGVSPKCRARCLEVQEKMEF